MIAAAIQASLQEMTIGTSATESNQISQESYDFLSTFAGDQPKATPQTTAPPQQSKLLYKDPFAEDPFARDPFDVPDS